MARSLSGVRRRYGRRTRPRTAAASTRVCLMQPPQVYASFRLKSLTRLLQCWIFAVLSIEQCNWQPCAGTIAHCCSLNRSCSPLMGWSFMTPAVPILGEVLAAIVCGTSVSPQRRIDTTLEDTRRIISARLTCSAAHMTARLTCLLAPRYHLERQCKACPLPLTPGYHPERQRTACPLTRWLICYQ